MPHLLPAVLGRPTALLISSAAFVPAAAINITSRHTRPNQGNPCADGPHSSAQCHLSPSLATKLSNQEPCCAAAAAAAAGTLKCPESAADVSCKSALLPSCWYNSSELLCACRMCSQTTYLSNRQRLAFNAAYAASTTLAVLLIMTENLSMQQVENYCLSDGHFEPNRIQTNSLRPTSRLTPRHPT